jgi:hypothetical protein
LRETALLNEPAVARTAPLFERAVARAASLNELAVARAGGVLPPERWCDDALSYGGILPPA